MTTIYDPILPQALVYIDDILLFSPNTKAHNKLLAQFADITEQYHVMLSKRKMLVGQSNRPHIAQELLKFPDESLTKFQVQQFLGIVNYLRDFVPNISKLTSPLSRLLKKNPPTWTKEQIVAVRKLKQIMQTLSPL
ncbi:hypothetical protein UlMin_002141 [Ulmus minor]